MRSDWIFILTSILTLTIVLFQVIGIHNLTQRNPVLGRIVFWAINIVVVMGWVIVIFVVKRKSNKI